MEAELNFAQQQISQLEMTKKKLEYDLCRNIANFESVKLMEFEQVNN